MHPAQGAAAFQGGEVAAHGLGGDPERVGEGGDLDPAGTTRLGDDPLLPLRCVHRTPSSCVVPIVPSAGRDTRKPPARREVNRFGHPFLWFPRRAARATAATRTCGQTLRARRTEARGQYQFGHAEQHVHADHARRHRRLRQPLAPRRRRPGPSSRSRTGSPSTRAATPASRSASPTTGMPSTAPTTAGTAGRPSPRGSFAERGRVADRLDDLHAVTDRAREEQPGLPVFLLGHSMGSFLARAYAAQHGVRARRPRAHRAPPAAPAPSARSASSSPRRRRASAGTPTRAG